MGAFPRRHGVRSRPRSGPISWAPIILKQASSGNTWSEVSEVRTVIDGQQRLTTMVIFFKALCAKNGTNNLFERDFVLETGDVALRHGKYDRQDFEKVVSATGCEPLEGSSAIVLAYNYFLKNIDPEKVDRNTIKSNVQFVCHRSYRGRGRAADIRPPSTRSGCA